MDSHGNQLRKGTKSDRISDLPEEIIQSILGRLPIRDTVRTSILSSNWRYKWTTLPHLVIDDTTFFQQHQGDQTKLVEIISSFLLRQRGPISKFSLSLYTLTRVKRGFVLDEWLDFLSNNGAITEFMILHEFINSVQSLYISSRFYSFASLRHLKLKGCTIPSPPPKFHGFNSLTSLALGDVTFNNEGVKYLIAKSPQLSRLRLHFVDGLDELNIHHAPKLQEVFFRSINIKQISFKNTPSLVDINLDSLQLTDMSPNLGNEKSTSLTHNLEGLSNVRVLKMESSLLEFLAHQVRLCLPSRFNDLCQIELGLTLNIDSVSMALRFIRNSPNLHTLVVMLSSTNSSSAEAQMKTVTEYLEVENLYIGCFMQLRYVKISCITGLGHEMQFIKMILGKSPILEEMIIWHLRKVPPCPVTESRILKELSQFPRASTTVKLNINGA